MAGSSLLTLIDDIATLLDDMAVLSKVAAKKTAGVLGDDLALNAEQVSGVRAERELPVVYAVAKGSLLNKAILVPAALFISLFIPALITPLLMLGGLYLCFEGVEKLHHSFSHNKTDQHHAHLLAIADPNTDMRQFEARKIKGAIRTDFILSAEIIVISLGTVQGQPFLTQALVLSTVAIAITIGIYSLVAAIVKLDDVGLYLLEKSKQPEGQSWQRITGRALLLFAPRLMKALSIVGTAAMFLVGGGILIHGLPALAEVAHHIPDYLQTLGISIDIIHSIAGLLFDLLAGIAAGLMMLVPVLFWQRMKQP